MASPLTTLRNRPCAGLLTVTFYLESRAQRLLRQCFEPVEQIFLARDADNLVAQLAVLEEKQRRNRANVVLG